MTWHLLRIHRGSRVIDALSTADYAQGTVNSRGSADIDALSETTVFLRDVRVGDVIEYAYSITGRQPALGQRFASALDLGSYGPVGRRRTRVLWRSERPLHYRVFGSRAEPRVREQAGATELVWDLTPPPEVHEEDNVPSWYDTMPWVQLSDFASWREVAAWALPMYRPPESLPAALEPLVSACRKEGDGQARMACAVRFVQEEVRYVAFEFGRGSLEPRAPGLVAERRFGDCKDKAMLLVTLLRALGFVAHPALVDADDLGHVRERLPSAYAFDHVIVRAELDGDTLWFDTTGSHERGPLRQRQPPDYRAALPIAPGAEGLERIVVARPAVPQVEVAEHFRIPAGGGPTQLEVVSRYRGNEASRVRRRFATRDGKTAEAEYADFYRNRYGKVITLAPLVVVDDPKTGELEVREHYGLSAFWDRGAELSPWLIADRLYHDVGEDRQAPLSLGHPDFVRHRIDVSLPPGFDIEGESLRVQGEHFDASYVASFDARAGRLRLDYAYRSRADQVRVAELAEYAGTVEKANAFLAYELFDNEPDSPPQGLPSWLPVALVLGVAGYAIAQRRSRRRRFARAAKPTRGESPAVAVQVPSLAQVGPHLTALRCDCPAAPSLLLEQRHSDLTYMGHSLRCQAGICPACGKRHPRYFRVVGAGNP